MKRILATACGGPSTLSFTRSLRDADPARERFLLIGTDCDKFHIHRGDVDKSFLCPKATDPQYIPFITELIREEGVDFLHSQPEIEAFVIGKHRDQITKLGCRLFMPAQVSIELLRDKSLSYKAWKAAGIRVPDTIVLNSETDLKSAYDRFGNDIWIRETIGAAGKGSLSRPTFEVALAHLNESKAWGHAVAAEHLTRDTVTWQSVWNNGRLVVAQGRKRLNWAFGNRAQSGVTGLTGVGVTICDPALDELSIECIKTIDSNPHGIFSVDFTYDSSGVANPTEINIAKFFTTHHFLTKTGCNMPEILVQLAFDEYEGSYDVRNPCRTEMYWIRGIDTTPILIDARSIESVEELFKKRMSLLE